MNYFVSNYIPVSDVGKHPKFSQAGSNFIKKLKDHIDSTIFLDLKIIGIDKDIYDACNANTVFENNILFSRRNKLITLINIIYSGFYLFMKLKRNKKIKSVWFYNISTFDFQLAAFLIRYFSAVKLKFLIADLETKKSIRIRLQNFLIKKSHKIISLRQIPYKSKLSNEVLNGIFLPNKDINESKKNKNKVFLYSGLIDEKHGMSVVIDTFKKLGKSETLYISGKVKDEKYLKKIIYDYSNIEYVGFLSLEDYYALLNEKITHCISFRNPKYSSNSFEFPSKIIEFIENGKTVISNEAYSPIFEDIILKCDYSVDSLYSLINSLPEFRSLNYSHLNSKLGIERWNTVINN